MNDFIEASKKIGFVMSHQCLDKTEVLLNKQMVRDSYNKWSLKIDHTFLNWGLWDKKINQEYANLNFDFSAVSPIQDIYSQLLFYYLIKPLIKMQFFNKRILEIGSGNGLGLRVSSELLKADYALGIDLSDQLVKNSHRHFYKEDKINYIQSDAEHLPIENESFDIITNLESSHVYPQIEHFFSEVERVLAPNGYFCYSDADYPTKSQSQILEKVITKNNRLKIIQKVNITKLVQASIYQRVITDEDQFYNMAVNFFGKESNELDEEILFLAYAMGLIFLPWWRIWFKRQELRFVAKKARKEKFWKQKYYFYYLLQKTDQHS